MGRAEQNSANDSDYSDFSLPGEGHADVNDFGETVAYSSTTAESIPSSEVRGVKQIGRYEIKGILGKGSFGTVYQGYDDQLNRIVAIKVPRHRTNSELQELFLAEARQLAQLSHPNIVSVFDAGVEDRMCYIVSEYLEGLDLNHWLKDNQPDANTCIEMVAQIADGLAYAHSQDTVHRDVKPANILVINRVGKPVPVLVDFGLALSDEEETRGEIVGTPNYMSPEQARGQGHRVDGRTDIYAAGVILYRMLSGKFPFQAPTLKKLLEMVIKDEPRPPRQFVHSISRELEEICLKAMAKNVSERYTTAGDFADDLRKLLAPQAAAERPRKAKKKRKKAPDGLKILIAEDQEVTRIKLQSDLEKWGHEVIAAEDGAQAWELFQQGEFSMVITDWMMPNMDGMELVQRIRAAKTPDYVYIIMLTAKAEKHDIVAGMGAGADDFLAKPFHRDELNVRLRAGKRITQLNKQLNESNRRMKSSLEAAARVQRSYLPTSAPDVLGFQFAWHYQPHEQLGGDMLNVVKLDEDHLGIYLLEVNGQGIPASLLSTSLCRMMAPASDPGSVLVDRDEYDDEITILDPCEVAERLNERFTGPQDAGQYFTMIYGVLDVLTREFRYTNAGHPSILHVSADGSPSSSKVPACRSEWLRTTQIFRKTPSL